MFTHLGPSGKNSAATGSSLTADDALRSS